MTCQRCGERPAQVREPDTDAYVCFRCHELEPVCATCDKPITGKILRVGGEEFCSDYCADIDPELSSPV